MAEQRRARGVVNDRSDSDLSMRPLAAGKLECVDPVRVPEAGMVVRQKPVNVVVGLQTMCTPLRILSLARASPDMHRRQCVFRLERWWNVREPRDAGEALLEPPRPQQCASASRQRRISASQTWAGRQGQPARRPAGS